MTANCRKISIGNTQNFRDLGGYATADGLKQTRWHCLYRSDNLTRIPPTPENVEQLVSTLNVGYTVDFRSSDERVKSPYYFDNVEMLALPIEPGDLAKKLSHDIDFITAEKCMTDIYEMFVNVYQPEFSRFFKFLVQQVKGEKAVVFHCNAGKDRTGYAAALLLLVLGVPLETVFEDYLLSNKCCASPSVAAVEAAFPDKKINVAVIKAFCYVRRLYLQRVLDCIHNTCGDVPTYVRTQLHISQEEVNALKKYYLE